MRKRIFPCFVLAAVSLLLCLSPGSGQDKKKPAAESLWDKLSLDELKFRAIGPALTSGRISDFAVNQQDKS